MQIWINCHRKWTKRRRPINREASSPNRQMRERRRERRRKKPNEYHDGVRFNLRAKSKCNCHLLREAIPHFQHLFHFNICLRQASFTQLLKILKIAAIIQIYILRLECFGETECLLSSAHAWTLEPFSGHFDKLNMIFLWWFALPGTEKVSFWSLLRATIRSDARAHSLSGSYLDDHLRGERFRPSALFNCGFLGGGKIRS